MKKFIKAIVVSLLTWEARVVLKKYRPKIVGVTGSVGKTSTKDAVAAVLGSRWPIRASSKSFNSEIGVPLTILNRPNAWRRPMGWLSNLLYGLRLIVFPARYPEWLILEIGADHPGDIRRLTSWVRPEVVVVTRFSRTPAHLEFFSSREELLEEKTCLASAVSPGGRLVLNFDDEEVRAMAGRTEAASLKYGLDRRADVYASHQEVQYRPDRGLHLPAGLSFKLNYQGSSVPVSLAGTVGRQPIYALLAGAAAGLSQGMNLLAISKALADYPLPPGRMRLLPGLKRSLLIDDTYNSSPVAASEALETLRGLTVPGRRLAVLGDMKELGEASKEAHRELGLLAAEICDELLVVGELAWGIAEGAREAGMPSERIREFQASQPAGEALEHLLAAGDVILVKGSQATRCEKVVEEVMNEPERASELLVRQEREWKASPALN